MTKKLPFALSKDKSFFMSLNDWIGDVLYDELTEKGLECRDEQIFMAFQIEKALKEKQILFAEAGVGTGKTIAYLLPAIAYARYTGKPALISCADETLIEQLVKDEGDIQKLSRLLDLKIDVRLAKARDQYVCLNRLEEAQATEEAAYLETVANSLPTFVRDYASMQEVYPYGDRADYPQLNDQQWQSINYHPIQQCSACDVRNRCGQTIHRNYYREAADLIICSHDFYMEHIWTKSSRQRQGQLPLLPEVSFVVFDEGHLLEYSAQRALTYEVQNKTLIDLLERIQVDDVRERTLQYMEQLIDLHEHLFDLLRIHTAETVHERKVIDKQPPLIATGKKAVNVASLLLEEFVFESELFTIPSYDLKMVEEYLEQYIFSMELFIGQNDAVDWVEDRAGETTLVIMPRLVTDILKEQLFSRKLPMVFSSATLSVKGDFSYLATSLGIDDYLSFSVPSPFSYEDVMKVFMTTLGDHQKVHFVQQLLEKKEQTLILFKSAQSMHDFQRAISTHLHDQIAFEGERELSTMIADFQHKKIPILCSYHLWEGLDIPEDALTRVILYDLPFPPSDPLFDAKRAHATHPFQEVDLPFMMLRLRQGVGRLIRTAQDRGTIHVLIREEEVDLSKHLEDLFPVPLQKQAFLN